MTTHPFRDGAPFLLIIETPPTFGRPSRFFHISHENCLLILSLTCFAVCGHHLSPRIAIVFSLLSSLPNSSVSHSSTSIISASNASRSSLYISLCESYFIVVPHGNICVATFSFSRLLLHLFLLPGRSRSPTRNRSFSFLYVIYWAVQIRFHSNVFLQPHVYISSVSSLSPHFLALTFPFLLPAGIISFTSVLYPPNFSIGQYLSLVSP